MLCVQLQQSKVSASAQQPSVRAAAVSVPVDQLSDAERQQLAHQYGYTKIGKQLPDGVTLSQIVKSMPSQVKDSPCWRPGLFALAFNKSCRLRSSLQQVLLPLGPWPCRQYLVNSLVTLCLGLLTSVGGAAGVGDKPLEGMECCSHHPVVCSCQLVYDSHCPLVPAPTGVGLCWHCLDWGKTRCCFCHSCLPVFKPSIACIYFCQCCPTLHTCN